MSDPKDDESEPAAERGGADGGMEFFVGYFPMTARQSRFSWTMAAIGLALVLGAGATIAIGQTGAGAGLSPFHPASVRGLLLDRPYPMLRTRDDDGAIHHVLLVRGGKFVWDAPPAAVGRVIELSGGLLERDGHRMLEVYSREDGDDAPGVELEVATTSLGEVELVGEIVDSKCYLGRMRPGGGRTHRACAQLCIAGGIPPVLVTHDAHGGTTHYLLASVDGGPVAREVLPYVAEPVRVHGRLERTADLYVLRIDPATIERR
ncbi:MAG: hypothetical protein AB7S26_29410 [Sandaracinaceae bacterium]